MSAEPKFYPLWLGNSGSSLLPHNYGIRSWFQNDEGNPHRNRFLLHFWLWQQQLQGTLSHTQYRIFLRCLSQDESVVLGYFRERCQNTDILCHLCLLTCFYCTTWYEIGQKHLLRCYRFSECQSWYNVFKRYLRQNYIQKRQRPKRFRWA